jgi:hypothetical protein
MVALLAPVVGVKLGVRIRRRVALGFALGLLGLGLVGLLLLRDL